MGLKFGPLDKRLNRQARLIDELNRAIALRAAAGRYRGAGRTPSCGLCYLLAWARPRQPSMPSAMVSCIRF